MVVMERLVYDATPTPGVIHVLGAELLVADVMIPPVKAEARPKARPLRGALALMAPGSGAALTVVDTQPRRRRSRGLALLQAISDVPPTDTGIDDDGPWWLQSVTTQHIRRAPDSRVDIFEGPADDGVDSGAEGQQWLDTNCGDRTHSASIWDPFEL